MNRYITTEQNIEEKLDNYINKYVKYKNKLFTF